MSQVRTSETEVLIVGAGPTGTTLAIDLARRGIAFRLIDRAPEAFQGSRAKGMQPRTQEVLEDLGALEGALEEGSEYPKSGVHVGPVVIPFRMQKSYPATIGVPYPNILLLPQMRTDAVLHRTLAEYGVEPEFGVGLTSFNTFSDGVTALLSSGEAVRARYLVGADGGGSTVRKGAGIAFEGSTKESDRMLIADATVTGLSRKYWHLWPKSGGRGVGACPLPGGKQFQIMMRLTSTENAELNHKQLTARFRSLTGHTLSDITWTSVFRPNVRLAATYRVGPVFIAGDAAHVHTPAGAQGLNTGVQDAYNLGWKLGQVLRGSASETILDSYEAERRPIAAAVLGRSSELYKSIEKGKASGMRRGDAERQLGVNYRGGPHSPLDEQTTSTLQVGDRAPDAACSGAGVSRLFEVFRGPHFTLLTFDAESHRVATEFSWPAGAALRVVQVSSSPTAGAAGITDSQGEIRKMYGITTGLVLVRPDGYVGAIAAADQATTLHAAARRLA